MINFVNAKKNAKYSFLLYSIPKRNIRRGEFTPNDQNKNPKRMYLNRLKYITFQYVATGN